MDQTKAPLPLEMLTVFGSAKLLSEVFEAAGQPGIAGEILAGAIIGPSVLGWVQPSELLSTLSELGVLFLLFRVGLEVRPSEFFRAGWTALLVATLGVILPFACGWAILLAFGKSSVEAIFAGAAMVATSVGITAQVLSSKGLLDNQASRVILAAAVIDDVLGLIVLATVSSVAKGDVNFFQLALTAALAIGFTIAAAALGSRAARRLVPHAEGKLRGGEVQFHLAIVFLFGLAVLAQYAGVAAIIGAFLAGMALSETVDHRVHTLSQGIAELMVPFFLVDIGLHFNVRALADPSTMWLALLILLAAVVSKIAGCGLGALSLGRRGAIRVGIGMVPRGEVGMVVAQIGMAIGVVEHAVYAVIVFMAVMTTLVAPPLLKWSFRDVEAPTP